MNIYERLSIRTVINGNATLTRLGGSIMPTEVVAAMVDASKHFVDIIELQNASVKRSQNSPTTKRLMSPVVPPLP